MRTIISKKLSVFIAVVLFSAAFSVIYTWYRTGNPLQSSTIQLGTIGLIMILIGLTVGRLFFQKILDRRPVKQLKTIILPALIFFFLVILLISLLVICLVSYVSYLIMGLDTSGLWNHLWQAEFPSAIRFYSVSIFVASVVFLHRLASGD